MAPVSYGAMNADPAGAPEGFLVTADDGTRLHFQDWGGPDAAGRAGVLLVPGLLQPAWSWAPVARRLRGLVRTVVADLRGHGLSDAPMAGYDVATLGADAVSVAEGSGALAGGRLVIAGHGFGAQVAARAAVAIGPRCAGLVLVDGGFERLEATTGIDVDEFLRGLDEPPEVMRSLDAWLADRRAFDPATWDADQERAARDAVVETAAGHVVKAVRPHVVEAAVRAMFDDDPAPVAAAVEAPVSVLVALDAPGYDERTRELRRTEDARIAAGRPPIEVIAVPHAGHNLMRYAPEVLATVILALATSPAR
jgi:pimeloyl-ACP methyl ester carboxylesterase